MEGQQQLQDRIFVPLARHSHWASQQQQYPRQQAPAVPSFHLAVSILLLFLTVYPYLLTNKACCTVSAYSALDVDLRHDSIKRFDIIQTSDVLWWSSAPLPASRARTHKRDVSTWKPAATTNADGNNDKKLATDSIDSNSNNLGFQKDLAQEASTRVLPSDSDDIHFKAHSTQAAPSDGTDQGRHTLFSERELNTDDNNYESRPAAQATTQQHVSFSSLGKRYKLILNQPANLITRDFNVVMLDADGDPTRVDFNRANLNVLEGYVDGQEGSSRVLASLDGQSKLVTVQIKTGQDFTIVEPTYLHKHSLKSTSDATGTGAAGDDPAPDSKQTTQSDLISSNPKLFDDTMIVYNLRDHKQFSSHFDATASKNHTDISSFCHYVVLKQSETAANKTDRPRLGDAQDDLGSGAKQESTAINNRLTRRGIEFGDESGRSKTRCTLHLVADYLFYKHVGRGDNQTTINYILALISRVNLIYLPTVWETDDERQPQISNIGFTVQNITIHSGFTRVPATAYTTEDGAHYNMANSSKVWSAREFLDNFSAHSPPRHYCLAHLLTYRQFDTPVLGLAYVASARFGTVGGICSPTQQRAETILKHNTGISTSKGINGETLITRQADLVVAHELGHNLGAEHDTKDCRPPKDEGGAYLMHPYAVMGFERNNRFMSRCTRMAVGRVVRRKGPTCFIAEESHVCGNGIVEDEEECDDSDLGFGQGDPCCDSSCRFTPGSVCSDRHSPCCNRCRIQPAGMLCRQPEPHICKQASLCDGRSAECLPSPPSQDNQTCLSRGLCRNGECTPFCEVQGLHSCLCQTPTDACKLCCKVFPNTTCHPFDTRAPFLPDGVLCYRGVCEKGRCEQPIQDFVERLWDVIEDITLPAFIKFLRDNIIFVVLIVSIPVWCIVSRYIDEFDRRIREDIMNAIARANRLRRGNSKPSPFMPALFVADNGNNIPNEANVSKGNSKGDVAETQIVFPEPVDEYNRSGQPLDTFG